MVSYPAATSSLFPSGQTVSWLFFQNHLVLSLNSACSFDSPILFSSLISTYILCVYYYSHIFARRVFLVDRSLSVECILRVHLGSGPDSVLTWIVQGSSQALHFISDCIDPEWKGDTTEMRWLTRWWHGIKWGEGEVGVDWNRIATEYEEVDEINKSPLEVYKSKQTKKRQRERDNLNLLSELS